MALPRTAVGDSRGISATDRRRRPSIFFRNRRLPAAISHRHTAKEKMSLRASTFLPEACSGDMYDALALHKARLGPRNAVLGMGHTKVEHLGHPVVGHENILGTDVPMDDVKRRTVLGRGVVRGGKPQRRIRSDRGHDAIIQAFGARVGIYHHPGQGASLQVLRGEIIEGRRSLENRPPSGTFGCSI